MKKEPGELGPFVEVFSKYADKRDTTGKFAVLEALAAKRVGWLNDKIKKLDQVDKTFSWKMPYAEDPEAPEVEAFLRSPEESMTIDGIKKGRKFTDYHDAKSFAADYKLDHQWEASYNMRAVDGDEPVVTVTKTRKWFDGVQQKLIQFKAELTLLTELYNGSPKKARHD